MAYPTTIDSLDVSKTNATPLVTTHPADHNATNTVVNALQAKVGIDSSAVTTSLDYKATNHTHSGTGSTKIPAANIDVSAFSASDIVTVKSDGTQLISSGKALSTDGTLASNSDAKVPTEKAVSTYVNIINVKSYGAKGDGVTDDTAAINSAIAAAAIGNCIVRIPSGNYIISAGLSAITANGVTIQGDGCGINATRITTSQTTGDVFSFNTSVQRSGVKDLYITYSSLPTAGNAISISGSAYRCFVDNVAIVKAYNGIYVLSSTETRLENIELRYLLGSYGVYYTGANGAGSYGCTITKLLADNPYPQTYGTAKITWATSTGFSLNDILSVNGYTYQCSNAGTSSNAGSGPTGIPGTTATNAFTTEITDGTVKWKFVNQNLVWIKFDNYAYSLRLNDVYLIDGYNGVNMTDSTNSGASYPMWIYGVQVEIDHSFANQWICNYGEGSYLTNSWIGSSLYSNGIVFNTNFRGEASVTNTRIAYCAQDGILVNGGQDYEIVGNVIGDNSQLTNNTYSGVYVAGNINKITITGNKIGNIVGVSGNPQQYGVLIANGTGDYINVVGNVLDGNTTGALYNGGTGLNNFFQGDTYAADAGANDSYAIAVPGIAVYKTGMVQIFKANTANTGAASLNINSLGAKTIVKAVNTTLANNDILAGMFCEVVYDGTNFVLLNPRAL